MNTAIFINARAANRFMDRVPRVAGRTIVTHQVCRSGALQGYKVVLDGVAVTDEEVEGLYNA